MTGKNFRGTGVALVTPFDQQGQVDIDALKKLVDKVIAEGVNYLVALGTTAETPTLDAQETETVLDAILAHNGGRVPVVCGIGGNHTAEVIARIQKFQSKKIDAILSVAPYYNKPTQEGLFQHFKSIADSTTLPVILYNVPGRTSSNILPSTVLRLAESCSNIVAIKEASGNLLQNMEIVRSKPADFVVLSGDDALVLPQMAAGIEGVISVAANCFTHDFSQMVNFALNGDYENARALHYRLLPAIDLLFEEGNPVGVKMVLHLQNICRPDLRLPLVKASESLTEKLKAYLAS